LLSGRAGGLNPFLKETEMKEIPLARAYDRAAIQEFGPFAALNFSEECE
jgi:hypothetical protein